MPYCLVDQVTDPRPGLDVLIDEELILLMVFHVGFVDFIHLDHVGCRLRYGGVLPGRHRRDDGIAQAGRRLGFLGGVDGQAGDIGVNLHPDGALDNPAAGRDGFYFVTGLLHGPEAVLGTVGHPFVDGPGNMGGSMDEGQPPDYPPGQGIGIGASRMRKAL